MARKFVAASSQALAISNFSVANEFTVAWWMQWVSLADNSTSGFTSDNFPTTPRYATVGPYYSVANGGWTFQCLANNTGSTVSTVGVPATGTWFSLVADRSGTTARGFVNNSQIGGNVTVGSGVFNFNNPRVGAHFFSGVNNQFGNILAAEVGVWSVRLSANDRAMLALGVSPLLVRPDALIHYWPLRHGYSPEIDLMSTNTASLTNAPTVVAHPRVLMPGPRLVVDNTLPPAPTPFDPLKTHGGQGRRRWDSIRTLAKERPDDVVLEEHVAALVAHLLGLPPSRPVPRKAVAVVAADESVGEALETFQWEVAEARARAAILESKVAGLERQKAIILKRIEDENDDEEAMELILGHA